MKPAVWEVNWSGMRTNSRFWTGTGLELYLENKVMLRSFLRPACLLSVCHFCRLFGGRTTKTVGNAEKPKGTFGKGSVICGLDIETGSLGFQSKAEPEHPHIV